MPTTIIARGNPENQALSLAMSSHLASKDFLVVVAFAAVGVSLSLVAAILYPLPPDAIAQLASTF